MCARCNKCFATSQTLKETHAFSTRDITSFTSISVEMQGYTRRERIQPHTRKARL